MKNEEFDMTDRKPGDDPSSSGVAALIERLRADGVEAGRAAKAELVAEGEREARQLVDTARREAADIVAAAKTDAAALLTEGKDALRVATRDTVLRIREVLLGRLETQLRLLIAKEMLDESFLRSLIVEITKRARTEGRVEHADDVEILLPQDVVGLDELRKGGNNDSPDLTAFAKEIATATLREGITIDVLEPGARGIRVRLRGEEVEIDLTDRAVADLLLLHLQPRFRFVLKDLMT